MGSNYCTTVLAANETRGKADSKEAARGLRHPEHRLERGWAHAHADAVPSMLALAIVRGMGSGPSEACRSLSCRYSANTADTGKPSWLATASRRACICGEIGGEA